MTLPPLVWNKMPALLADIVGMSVNAGLAIAAIAALAAVLEGLWPRVHNQSWLGRGRNIVYSGLYLFVGGGLILLWRQLHVPTLVVRPAESAMGWWMSFSTYLLLWDFLYYWYHRAQHRWSTLWAIHELHHADAELNVTSSLRVFPFERLIQYVLITYSTTTLLSIRPSVIVWAGVVHMTWNFLTHINTRIDVGVLRRILCGPGVHRLHHSAAPQHRHVNFAQMFVFYDVLFGTYAPPPTEEPFPMTGTAGLDSAAPVGQALLQPFRLWRQQLRRRD